MLRIKRVYEGSAKGDGFRMLVDRLWPRGLTKEKAGVDSWLREIAPSNELRKWYGHDPEKWPEFKKRYFKELKEKEELVRQVEEKMRKGTVTLLFQAKEEKYNNAAALKEYVEKRQ
jgi:uncharacterized protein YeaO (DUF488 family)